MKKSKDIERRSTQIGQIFIDKENYNHSTLFHYSIRYATPRQDAVAGGLIRIFKKENQCEELNCYLFSVPIFLFSCLSPATAYPPAGGEDVWLNIFLEYFLWCINLYRMGWIIKG